MKPWLKEICDQVEDGTALPARIGDALAVFRRWGFDEDAPLFTMAGELVAMLIERCEQQDAELSRLRTLEAAAIAVVRTRQEVATETGEKLRQSR